MLGKILLLGLAFWLILNLLNRYRRSMESSKPPQPTSQDMVRCAACGLHLPKSEGIERDGVYYCCAEHSERKAE